MNTFVNEEILLLDVYFKMSPISWEIYYKK